MKILITAGGTSEKIDNVRQITNKATGKLGCLIAQEFCRQSDIEKIYYVCGETSISPELPLVEVIRVDDVEALKCTIESILKAESIDAVIHSMAVSDYSVNSAFSIDSLADALSDQVVNKPTKDIDKNELTYQIKKLILQNGESFSTDCKISSDIENLVLVLEKTPKVIGIFKALQSQTVLVGFKLLDGVSKDELIGTAFRLLTKNQCDFVLANDSQSFQNGSHTGYLIFPNRESIQFEGKEAIARGIVRAVMERVKGVNS